MFVNKAKHWITFERCHFLCVHCVARMESAEEEKKGIFLCKHSENCVRLGATQKYISLAKDLKVQLLMLNVHWCTG